MMARRRVCSCVCIAMALACGSASEDDAGALAEPGELLWESSVPAAPLALALARSGSADVLGDDNGGAWVGKYSEEGELLWSKNVLDVRGRAIADDSWQVYCAFGPRDPSALGGRVTAYDRHGALVWTVEDATHLASALAVGPGGGVFVAGSMPDPDAGIFVQRILADGTVQWQIEDDTLGGSPDAVELSTGVALTGVRRDGSWWVHYRSYLGDSLWTAELGPVNAAAFPSLSYDGSFGIFASVLVQDDTSRGVVAKVSSFNGDVDWLQPLESPPTDVSVRPGGPLLLSGLFSPSIVALGNAGEELWVVDADSDCSKTYAVVQKDAYDAVILRHCDDGDGQLARVQVL